VLYTYNMSASEASTDLCAKELLGRVKWFNNKAGYGFVTVCEGEYKDKDIFSHFSSIMVTKSQYKYLVQGEYVQFDLAKSSEQGHEFKALSITGVRQGELMCETRATQMREKGDSRRPHSPPMPDSL
jgi:cold shock CspA family protein